MQPEDAPLLPVAPEDAELFASLYNDGYCYVRRTPKGVILGLMPFIYTWGVCIIENKFSYRTRYCYSKQADALEACVLWDGETGDPPGPWIVEKPAGRMGPGARHDREPSE